MVTDETNQLRGGMNSMLEYKSEVVNINFATSKVLKAFGIYYRGADIEKLDNLINERASEGWELVTHSLIYSNNEMTKGKLLGDRYKTQWIPDGYRVPQTIFGKANGQITLRNDGGWLRRPYTESCMCLKCRKLINQLVI